MIVLAREVFACKCSTDVPSGLDEGLARELRFVRGSEAHLARLDPAEHGDERVADFRARLARGEHWLLGLLGERIATYTWLHARARCEYPYLPGCVFALSEDMAYGYDAWTAPALRGAGLRRRAFVEELRILFAAGKLWEASFFVAHQLDGARESLSRVGAEVVPVWRIALGRDRKLRFEQLADDDGLTPLELTPPMPVKPPDE
jgi:hypothetical protein